MAPRSFDNFEDFMSELDRSSNLSDDPFGIEAPEEMDDEDLVLIGGGRRPAPSKAPRRRTRSKYHGN